MTPNKEDYLKAIFAAASDMGLASNKKVADALQVSPASVSEMLLRLQKEGLIIYTPYKGSKLTEKGITLLYPVVQSHRLWEVFLMQYLGYTWREAHEDAHLLEHATSERLLSRLDAFLEYPSHCPHGNPIQRETKSIDEISELPLSTLNTGETGEILRVEERGELLDMLTAHGLHIGSRLKKQTTSDFSYENKTISLKESDLDHIYVKPVHPEK